MFVKVNVRKGDIKIGKSLPWPVYSADETLLLKAGTTIKSERQLEILLQEGLYRGPSKSEIAIAEKEKRIKNITINKLKKVHVINIFKLKYSCATLTQDLLNKLVTRENVDVAAATNSIYEKISQACNYNSNAALAAVHLSKDFSYNVLHPLHTATLCEILIRRLSFKVEQERSVISAALTMNIGMHESQERLFSQASPLTDAQKKEIFSHPTKSAEILREANIEDKNWLAIVEQHHERINGLGYPNKLTDKQIHQGAKIVALADIYSAMITPREYRKPMTAHNALKKLFTKRGKDVDDSLMQMLIKEVGVYPPGSFVKLINGEIAVVVKRAIINNKGAKTHPIVCSLFSPRGGKYDQYSMRDTGDARYMIRNIEQPTLDEPINYPKIWGFRD